MTSNDSEPSRTDTGWFTDAEQLGTYMDDMRIADTRMSSSFEDAQYIVAEFAASGDNGAWSSLDRATVAERLQTLIAEAAAGDTGAGYRSLMQAGLNLCKPTALLVMAMGRDPAAVARYATDLFNGGTGYIGDFGVTASDDLLAADFNDLSNRGSIASQAEWMMLSAIRNATEPFWQPEWTGDPDQELAGLPRPEELADWMRQTNIWSDVTDNGRWATNPGIPDATSIVMYEGVDLAMLIHVNLIHQSTIVDSDQAPKQASWSVLDYFPNHWVILLSEITPQLDDNSLVYSIWTFGGRMRLRTPQQVFIDNYFGTVSATL